MTMIRRIELTSGSTVTALLVALLAMGLGTVASGSDHSVPEGTTPEAGSEKAVVVPYKTRPAPTHRVSLRDDRVFFVKKLEQTENGFVLHTLEDEVIEVEQSNVAEIVEFKSE